MIVVQHGGHAVEPEAVEMVLLQPELQIGKQKVQNAGLTVIKALGSPGRMLTLFSVVEELPGGAVKHIDAICGILDRVGMNQINMETSVQNRTDRKKSVTQNGSDRLILYCCQAYFSCCITSSPFRSSIVTV